MKYLICLLPLGIAALIALGHPSASLGTPKSSGVTCAQIAQSSEGMTLSQMSDLFAGAPVNVLDNSDGDYTLQYGGGDAFNGATKADFSGPILRVMFGKNGKLADRVLIGQAYGCYREGIYAPKQTDWLK